MLERVDKSGSYEGKPLFRVSNLPRDAQHTCIAYVQGGQHKFTRADKPFITLYLKDDEGVVIPGYIFEVANFKSAGLELTKVIHSFVLATVTENYHPRFGMSVLVNKLSMIMDPTPLLAKAFLGEVRDQQQCYQKLMECITGALGIRISVPYTICTTSYMDFYQGRVGGQCQHYQDMFDVLKVWSDSMNEEEKHQLFATFVLYVFVHNNYLSAREQGNDDVRLINTLASAIEKHMVALKAGDGVSEVIHLFFGYEPKDLFVRMVHQASLVCQRAMNELATYRSLPISREGDAGYGTIKRYDKKE